MGPQIELPAKPAVKAGAGQRTALRDWLNNQSDFRVWITLFAARWLVALVILAIFHLAKLGHEGAMPQWEALIRSPLFLAYVFLIAPVVETAFECSLPHLLMKGRIRTRPWRFAAASATLMVLIHPIGPALSVMPLLTGLTLAYCYLVFAKRHSAWKAFAATCAMHLAINLSGAAFATVVLRAVGST